MTKNDTNSRPALRLGLCHSSRMTDAAHNQTPRYIEDARRFGQGGQDR